MAEDIIVRYRAEVDEATQKINKFAKANQDVSTSTDKASKSINKTTKSVSGLEKEVADTGKKVADSAKQVDQFGKKANSTFSSLGSSIKTFAIGAASGIAAGFSVGAIIAFGKESINALLEAEKNAERLKFAIIDIGGESEATFNRLIQQSAQIQKVSIFSDDSIQQAQAALKAFGLTGAEIEELIPKLADFATLTGVDIAQAAQQVGAGLEGAGREFKKYGIEVSATASRQQNLNNIVDGFSKFAGSAEAATKTYAGQLAQLNNRVDDLQEKIGEKLTPLFVNLKLGIFEVLVGLGQLPEKLTKVFETIAFYASTGKSSVDILENSFISFEDEIVKTLAKVKTLSDLETAANKLRVDQSKNVAEQNKVIIKLEEALQSAQARKVVNLKEVQSIESAIAKQKDTNYQNEIIKLGIIDSLIEEKQIALSAPIPLTDAQIADLKKAQDDLAKLRLANIKDERVLREAQFASDIKAITATGKLRNEIIIELQKALDFDLRELDFKQSQAEKEELDKRDKALLASNEKQRAAEEATQKERIERAKKANNILIQLQLDADKKLPEKDRKQIAVGQAGELTTDADTQIAKVKADVISGEIGAEEDAKNKIIIIKQELADKIKAIYEGLGLVYEQTTDSELKQWFDRNDQILSTAQELYGSLTQLYSTYVNAQIAEIERAKEAEITALDAQLTANDDALSKRRISETEAAANEKKLIEEKSRVEAEAAKKERELKRKQAIADKAAALIQIAINTAEGITKAVAQTGVAGIVLGALIAALGAAQAAVVAAQPIPYEKGTKSAKGGLSKVGEKGEEIMYVPGGSKVLPNKQTNRYGEVLDAMFDNRFDQYVLNRYVNPALMKERSQRHTKQQESFAQNIANSLTTHTNNGVNLYDLKRIAKDGYNISNIDALADAIASKLPQADPYRR